MRARIVTFLNGKWRQNCYIVGSENNEAIIIDPGSDSEGISSTLRELGWKPLAIVNTHAHYDHIGAVSTLMEQFKIPFYLHGNDEKLLRSANAYSLLFGTRQSINIPNITYDMQSIHQTFNIGGFTVKWLKTPGHTPGSICLVVDDNLFTGDTLFADGVGRTDFPGGNADQLAKSIISLKKQDPDLKVYAGHGDKTFLGKALEAADKALENK